MAALSIAATSLSVVAPALADTDGTVKAAAGARSDVNDAMLLIMQMKRDHKLARLLARSKGVFLMPHYGKGGLILGGGGGAGLLLVHRDQQWFGPVFYSVGGFSFGLQAGAAGGPIAMLLMNDQTVAKFEDHASKWSMDTNAGVTVVKYGGATEAESAYPDIVLWTGLKGLYGGVSVGANNITVDSDSNRGYYHRDMTPRQILAGNMKLSHSQPLHSMLGGTVVAKAK
jgi:lipid-binding SYLF domain-containing protein